MGIRVLAGRSFLPSDHDPDFGKLNTIIINKNAMNLFGFANSEDALGREILWGNNGTRKWKIIGVVNDYHQEGLQKPMEQMLFRPAYSTGSPISIKLQQGVSLDQALTRIESTYKKFFAGNSFEYFFLEDQYKKQYKDEARFSKVITIFHWACHHRSMSRHDRVVILHGLAKEQKKLESEKCWVLLYPTLFPSLVLIL
jgi:putative ABC transport system permease protein